MGSYFHEESSYHVKNKIYSKFIEKNCLGMLLTTTKALKLIQLVLQRTWTIIIINSYHHFCLDKLLKITWAIFTKK